MTAPRRRLPVVALLVGVSAAGLAPRPAAGPEPVTFLTEDGVSIAAELRQPSARPAPAVILVHMVTRTRADWAAAADRLSEAGLVVLAMDLRGHGASGVAAEPAANPDDMNASVRDVRAARVFLSGRPDLCSGRIGIAGAQVGASLAILEAASDPLVASVALLSPGLDYRRLRPEAAMKKYNDRPALILASAEDAYASRSARELSTLGSGIRDFRLLNGAGHGTVMLARQPDLIGVLVDWFRRTLI
ncbi:MAG: alpha/beta hydrolase [Planctomycetes bacterium]|nr:alpha/beta hydrolase [Planctomycetota bacterium]